MTNLLTFTSVNPDGAFGVLTTDPNTGIQWQMSRFEITITNNSAFTITNLVSPLPFTAVAYLNYKNFHPMTWTNDMGLWLSNWLTPASNASYINPALPNPPYTGYAMSARDENDASMLPLEAWADFSPYMASSFYWSVTNSYSTVSASDSIPVITPVLTTLTPGESTTMSYSIWREYNKGGYLGFDSINAVIGTVQCP